MNRRHLARRLRDRRGQSLIEFALVALLLVMLVVGIVDISRLLLTYTTIANAARAGTRFAIVHGSNNTGGSNVTTYVQNYLSAAGMRTASPPLTLNITGAGGAAGSTVTVTVTYAYSPFTTYFPLKVTLRSTSQGVIVF